MYAATDSTYTLDDFIPLHAIPSPSTQSQPFKFGVYHTDHSPKNFFLHEPLTSSPRFEQAAAESMNRTLETAFFQYINASTQSHSWHLSFIQEDPPHSLLIHRNQNLCRSPCMDWVGSGGAPNPSLRCTSNPLPPPFPHALYHHLSQDSSSHCICHAAVFFAVRRPGIRSYGANGPLSLSLGFHR